MIGRSFVSLWPAVAAGTIVLAAPAAALDCRSDRRGDLIDYVDPFIGTGGKGKTYPGATAPHGMIQLSPDNGRNGWDWIAGYFHPDDVIAGFSHTHLTGTGAGDLYDISFMPLTRPFERRKLDEINPHATIVSTFSHSRECAAPGLYRVHLGTYDIDVALTASERVGYQRYRFAPDASEGVVRLDLGYARNWDKTVASHIEILDDHTIAGYRKSTGWARDQRVYFHTRFSRPIARYLLARDGAEMSGKRAYGKDIAAEFTFALPEGGEVLVRTAISSVSADNARANLEADGEDIGFDAIVERTRGQWEKALRRVRIRADRPTMTQFYTALYHSHLAPQLFSDVDGRYLGPDGEIHRNRRYPAYSLFSLWDTFRALHPWKTITEPEETRAFAASMMDHYRQSGMLPVWSMQGGETDMMLGYHAVPVLIDAWLKGQTDIDGDELLAAAKKSALQERFGIGDYRRLGYVPIEAGSWNAARTLEYAFDDAAIARLAGALGRTEDQQEFARRARSYRNQFDAETGMMRGRHRDGTFRKDFDPLAYRPEDFAEANAAQYSWFVPHDVDGLVELLGGREEAERRLDALFVTGQSQAEPLPEWISGFIGQYVHGNEPTHHVPYLYALIGRPAKTQARVREIMRDLYATRPDGLAGNEDAGQMSAWYLFSALGFYPVDPVSGRYVLGSPAVSHADIALPGGKRFRIKVRNQSDRNIYVRSVTLNGRPLGGVELAHDQIMAGGILEFVMDSAP